jgi:enoyl-[acyl-carrier protein] reductase II
MKTKITEMLGIKYPFVLSGMSWISTPKMVAAVSNAGGLGMLATGPLGDKEVREAIKEIRNLTDKPFGANISLLFPGAQQNAEVLLAEHVPVINFSLGKGDWIVKSAHSYGGKVLATVTNARHAKRAQDYGVDGVIATGNEAAAHGEEVTSLVLIPALADTITIPIIAAGGFADARGIVAALALGADGVAMGTRLMTTKESPLNRYYKDLCIKKDVYDTLYSARFDGLLCRVMDTAAARAAIKKGLRPLAALVNSKEIAQQIDIPYYKLFLGVLASGMKNAIQLAFMANAFKAIRLATEHGNSQEGVLPVGQVQGLIHDEPTVAELFARIAAEVVKLREELSEKLR